MVVLRALAGPSRPLYVLLAALTYLLGAGVARYLGVPIRPDVLCLGLVGTVLSQTSMSLLAAVFGPAHDWLDSDLLPERRRGLRDAMLYLSIAALAAAAFIGFFLYSRGGQGTASLLGPAFSLVVTLLYAVPPARLLDRGFGETLLAIQIAYVAPSIGFLLQAGSYHRLLMVCIIPLTLLLLATLLALNFPTYADDLKHARATLPIRVGWQNALRLHRGLVIAAYALLGSSIFLGFSFRLLSPAFLTVPFAALQLYLLHSIGIGAKPLWGVLRATSVAVFGLTAYFLTLNFWLR